MAFIGLATGLTVWALGLHLVLTLALLAALLNFIPNFGPLAAAIPAALLALLLGPMTALWVLVAYILIQFLQDHLVTPLIQQRTVRLPPILLILAQIILYYSERLLGMALAPPLAASALALVDLLYVRHILGDPMAQDRGFWPDGATSTSAT